MASRKWSAISSAASSTTISAVLASAAEYLQRVAPLDQQAALLDFGPDPAAAAAQAEALEEARYDLAMELLGSLQTTLGQEFASVLQDAKTHITILLPASGDAPGLTCTQMNWHYAHQKPECDAGCGEPCVRKQWCSTGYCEPWPHYCRKCRAPGGGGGGAGGSGNLYTYSQQWTTGQQIKTTASAETDYGSGTVAVRVEARLGSNPLRVAIGYPSATVTDWIWDDGGTYEVLHKFSLVVGEYVIRRVRQRFFVRGGVSALCYQYWDETAQECLYTQIVPCNVRCAANMPLFVKLKSFAMPRAQTSSESSCRGYA